MPPRDVHRWRVALVYPDHTVELQQLSTRSGPSPQDLELGVRKRALPFVTAASATRTAEKQLSAPLDMAVIRDVTQGDLDPAFPEMLPHSGSDTKARISRFGPDRASRSPPLLSVGTDTITGIGAEINAVRGTSSTGPLFARCDCSLLPRPARPVQFHYRDSAN